MSDKFSCYLEKKSSLLGFILTKFRESKSS